MEAKKKENIFKPPLVEVRFLCTPFSIHFHGAQLSLRPWVHKGNGEIVESQCLSAVDLKVYESSSSRGHLRALSERAEMCLFLQVTVFKLSGTSQRQVFWSLVVQLGSLLLPIGCVWRAVMYVQAETSSTHMDICVLLLTRSLRAHWLQNQAWSVNQPARHVLLDLLHQPGLSIGNGYTSNTHT